MIKKGTSRRQMMITCLEDRIASDSIVRLIDIFVDSCSLNSFVEKGISHEGRPGYSNSDMLKLYLYGYIHKTRSSRDIAKLTILNIEVRWLLKGLSPCHMTISTFRRQNKAGFTALFKAFNGFLRGEDLFDRETIAVDGSIFKAQNSRSNNHTSTKVNKSLKTVDNAIDKYMSELDANDKEQQSIDVKEKLRQLEERKKKLTQLNQQIEEAKKQGETQVSFTDPDARSFAKGKKRWIGYNLVTAAEAKNKFIVDLLLTNRNDINTLSQVSIEARQTLGKDTNESINVIADRGFDSGRELKRCSDHNIDTYVAVRKRISPNKDDEFNVEAFTYNKQKDHYICPQGQQLTTNGKQYLKRRSEKHWNQYYIKKYKGHNFICTACPHFDQCCTSKAKHKTIERTEYQDYVDENKKRVAQNPTMYKKRMGMVEHPFGTIKRQWGYDYTLLKTLPKVTAELTLIVTVYNIRRAISILGVNELIKRLKSLRFYPFFQIKTHLFGF